MSLTQTAYTSRKIIKFGGIGLVGITLFWNISILLVKAYQKSHPKYIPPTVAYGILPKITFPEQKAEPKTFTFELPNDEIPNFSDQARVYVIYRPNTTFLALEEDKKTATSFGFPMKPTELKEKPGVYEFKDDVLNKILTVNVLDGDFKMRYPYLTDQLLLTSEDLPTKDKAIEIASGFLSQGNKLTDDLKNGQKRVSFWKIQDGGIKATESQSQANAVRVDFFREDLNNLKLLSTNYDKASVSILISGSRTEARKIIEFNFKDISIDRESYATYPIKTAQEAIKSLTLGNYWTSVDVADKNVVIRRMYLAYYEPNSLTNFLQPIYVFEGDNGFVAYIPAIKSEYFK